jgi:20S proteasome alpha/beta subunit
VDRTVSSLSLAAAGRRALGNACVYARINCVTIAAACRFPEGVALITDSRATWKTPQFPHYEDRLQKILALDRKVGLAYAGNDIRIPEAVARLLRQRIAADPRRAEPERIASVLPRIARSCYREYVKVMGHGSLTSLILAGTTQSGRVVLYTFEAPEFVARSPADDFVVVGSGAGAAHYEPCRVSRSARYVSVTSSAEAVWRL